jgi:asparagine synthase (glutamine-hydrolysing)
MRLICGVLRLDGQAADGATLDAMAAAMTYPGLSPAVAQRLDGPLGLAVLDFAPTGAGPEIPEIDGRLVAADARLDRCATAAEAAFVEAAERCGADFPDRVDGDFAVALWRRDRGELLLGRDFIGVRPLAWTWRPGCRFAFASLPKGLHRSGQARPDIDRAAIAGFAAQQYFFGSDSGFADIAYLRAGHSLTVRPDDPAPPRPHRAYRPDPAQVGRRRITPEEAAATLRRLVTEAVESRMPAAGPVACHLSGGLDSSAVTVLAARAARRRGERTLALTMTAQTAIGPVDLDERPMIAAVLEQESDITHTVVHNILPLPGLAHDEDWLGMPVGEYDDRMAAAAAAFGADRIFNGVGGDEGATYNGLNLYLNLLKAGRLGQLARELPARARSDGQSLWRAVRGRLISPLIPQPLRMLRRRLKGSPMVADPNAGLARYLTPAARNAASARRLEPILTDNSAAERARAFADHHIPSRCAYYAVMAARRGLAVTYPLLDRRVVDFMLSLPNHMFLADGQSRQPFRRAMQGILPDVVRLAKHKVGIADDWYIRYAAIKADLLAEAESLRGSPEVTAIFDLDAVRDGLSLLPDPENAQAVAGARAAEGVNPSSPRWPPFMAVRALVIARHLARLEQEKDQSNRANST